MCNTAIRSAIQNAGVRHWMVADELGISETTFCRMLRKELPGERREEVLQAVQNVKMRREA